MACQSACHSRQRLPSWQMRDRPVIELLWKNSIPKNSYISLSFLLSLSLAFVALTRWRDWCRDPNRYCVVFEVTKSRKGCEVSENAAIQSLIPGKRVWCLLRIGCHEKTPRIPVPWTWDRWQVNQVDKCIQWQLPWTMDPTRTIWYLSLQSWRDAWFHFCLIQT